MRLKVFGYLLAFLPLLLHAENPTEARPALAWYIDKTANSHAKRARELRRGNFRPLSLSAYGNPGETRFAASWVMDGRYSYPWQMVWGKSKKEFDDWVAEWSKEGFRLSSVSANGPAGKAEFHGVMTKLPRRRKWAYKCEIEDLEEYLEGKDSNGISRVVSFRMYGEIDNRRYCVVLHENEGNERWALEHSEPGLMPNESWTSAFNYPHASRQFLRPSKLFMSDDGVITPLMTDMGVGGWSAAVRLNMTEMASEIGRQGEQWFFPIDIQGASAFGKTQFNAVFAERMTYQSRLWNKAGQTSGFKNNKRAQKELDKMMEEFMKENGIRQAQVAIGARGHVMAERSYTWAETTYGTVGTSDVFLLGGVSKMFLYAAVKWCVDQLMVTYDTPVYKLLGYRRAFDKRIEDITIQHLLDHTAGYDRDESGEAAFDFGKVGLQLPHNGTEPATLHDLIKYKLNRKLDYSPGERMVHSHYGSLLLGAVVANLTEMPYVDFLKKHILDGLDVSVFETASEAHIKDKVVQEGLQIGIDARYPAKQEYVAGVYGGDGAVKEECAAAFSLRSSASSLVKFAGHHCKYPSPLVRHKTKLTHVCTAVARLGKRRDGYRRGGIEGGYAYVESHGDFDFALVFNTREFASKNAVLDLAHGKIRKLIDEKRYGPMTLTCNPGPEIFEKAYPGMDGISPDSLDFLPDCTKEELDEMMHDREDKD
jgi:CubicO group peptidase (beta-lactamase class C family)